MKTKKTHLLYVFSGIMLFVSTIAFIFCCIEFGVLKQNQLNPSMLIISVTLIFIMQIASLTGWIVMCRIQGKSISKALRVLKEAKIEKLGDSLSMLSQGNLAVKNTFSSDSDTKVSIDSSFGEIADLIRESDEALVDMGFDFNTVTDTPCDRLCFVGGDIYKQGQQCAEIAADRIDGRGRVLISTGFIQATGQELRRKGFFEVVHEKYQDIEIVDILESKHDPVIAYKTVKSFLENDKNIQVIYVTEGSGVPGICKAVYEEGLKGKIKIICHDLSDEIASALKSNDVEATLLDNTFAQGYDPIVCLFNNLASGWIPDIPQLIIEAEEVTAYNIDEYWSKRKGLIVSETIKSKLKKPVEILPEKTLKIGVIGCENSEYWFPIRDGVLAAKEQLKRLNVSVEWIAPKGVDLTAEVCGPIIERFIKERYDGFALIMDDRKVVEYVNRAVKSGIPVISFITEPTGLRSLVSTITMQSEKLLRINEHISTTAMDASILNKSIKGAMENLNNGSKEQNREISETNESMNALSVNIQKVETQTKESSKSAVQTELSVDKGIQALEDAASSLKTVSKSVDDTSGIVDNLIDDSEKIDDIIKIIENIAEDVHVLSVNAAIEAARAGEAGKGFLVVSTEIRKLAKNTGQATERIAAVIDKIKDNIRDAKARMNDSKERVIISVNLSNKVANNLNDINQHVNDDKTRLDKIASTISEITEFSANIKGSMAAILNISTDHTKTVEDVDDHTKDLENKFSKVLESIEMLNRMANVEKQLLSKFYFSGT